MKKKIFIITGEHSGDLHATYVVEYLKQLYNDEVEIEGIGGENLKKAGIKLFSDHKKMSSVGLDLKIIIDHYKLGKRLVNYLKNEYKPNLILLIDYGGFNLNISKFLKKAGLKIYYFIPPQIWASRKWRIGSVKKYIDKVFTIFPFENHMYEANNIDCKFVGHPLINELKLIKFDEKNKFFEKYNLDKNKKLISIFPGSRVFEIKFLLKIFIKAKRIIEKKIDNVQFVLCQADNLKDEIIKKYLGKEQIKILKGENYNLLKHSDGLILASGTVALEAALIKTPMVISYKGPWIFYIVYLMVRCIKMVSLPNIILNKVIIQELIQSKCNAKNIAKEIIKILRNKRYKKEMIENLNEINKKMGEKNSAKEVAQTIYNDLNIEKEKKI